MRPGKYALSLDQREYAEDEFELRNLLSALSGGQCAPLAMRDVLASDSMDFAAAVHHLASVQLITTSYIIVSGTGPTDGAVITRKRLEADNVWHLNATGSFFVVETNYDHWQPAGDDRRQTAINALKRIGEQAIDLNGLFKVLSTPPVLNDGTTYTALMSASQGVIKAFARFDAE